MRRDWRQIDWDTALETRTRQLFEIARDEDLGERGDITSAATVPAEAQGIVVYRPRHPGTVAGIRTLAIAAAVYDPELRVTIEVEDGETVEAGRELARLSGPARSILAVERPSLNLLGRLCGIATATRQRVDRIASTGCRLYDTRKTTPGLRLLEKFAVRCGGGHNHRTGLFDGLLIKDNHLALAGSTAAGASPAAAVRRARSWLAELPDLGNTIPIEVEIDSWEQFVEAIAERPDLILLDNLGADRLREAVAYRDRHAPDVELEASGGITDRTLLDLASTGIDRLSMGALTHSAVQLDIGLDWVA